MRMKVAIPVVETSYQLPQSPVGKVVPGGRFHYKAGSLIFFGKPVIDITGTILCCKFKL
jgi:hypothetical protein